MNGKIITIIVGLVAVALVAGIGIGYVTANDDDEKTPSFDIIYVLDGGVNSTDNPSEYKEGDTILFKDPTKVGYIFNGWYLNSEFTEKTNGISSDTVGDVIVYASWIQAGIEYSIIYMLYGGINSDENPSSYLSGTTLTFAEPTLKYHDFVGWFTDENCTQPITGIEACTTGDMTLYAGWNSHLEGHGFETTVEGSTSSFLSNVIIDGTYSWKYLYQNAEGDYLIEYSYELSYNNRGIISHSSNTGTYWTDETSEMVWSYEGTKTVDTVVGYKECYIVTGTDDDSSETQYIGDGWIPYLIYYEENSLGSSTYITYTFSKELEFEPEVSVDLDVYSDLGLDVTVKGDLTPGSEIELKVVVADGYTFKGWYNSDGVQLSTDTTYVIEEAVGDIEVYAFNDRDPDLEIENGGTETFTSEIQMADITWYILDYDTHTVIYSERSDELVRTFNDAGHYWIIASGETGRNYSYSECFSIVVTGVIDITYDWKFDGRSYTYILGIEYTDMLEYRNANVSRSQGTVAHDLHFVTYKDKYVVELAEYFESTTTGWDDLDVANFVLEFVHSIPYQSDSDTMGVNEYWKYPLETLFDVGGDCEDLSILYAALMKAMGYDVALLLFSGHMAAGIYVTGCDGYGFSYGGTVYYFCETTSEGFSVGDNSDPIHYNTFTTTVMPVV